MPQTCMARKRIRRSSENRLGMAMVRPAHIGKFLDGPVLRYDNGAAIAMAEVDDLDGNALRLERDASGATMKAA